MTAPEQPHALVFAHGEAPSPELAKALAARAGLVVAADGGVHRALACGVIPDAVVGDLDSAREVDPSVIPPERFHRSDDVDTTDLQKAVTFCVERGFRRVDVVAAGGGRADHALANLSVIPLFRGIADVRIVDDFFEIRLVDGSVTFDAEPATVVSLVALGACEGVTTHGLRWELTDYPLAFSPRGVHNEVATSPVTVSVEKGDQLLFLGRWAEHHRWDQEPPTPRR